MTSASYDYRGVVDESVSNRFGPQVFESKTRWARVAPWESVRGKAKRPRNTGARVIFVHNMSAKIADPVYRT